MSVYTPPPSESDDVKSATLRAAHPPPSEGAGLPQGVAPTHGERSGKAVYALRKHIERINADRKNHGFAFLPVGGLIKAKAHALWRALANNLVAAHRLRIKIT